MNIKTRTSIIIIVVIAAILVGIYYGFYASDNIDQESITVDTNTTDILDDSPTILSMIVDDPDREVVSLEAVGDVTGNGTAYRRTTAEILDHAVVAELPDPEEGISYEGWLVDPSSGNIISTGVMEKQSTGTWQLEFTDQRKYVTYTNVVITAETEVDETPETHILEGSF